MKKWFWNILVFALLTVLVVPASRVSAAGPSGSWASGIACQNLDSSSDATVTLLFYPEMNAATAITYTTTIPAGGSKNWLTTSSTSMPGFPSNFVGSAVVSSDKPIACNVNTQSTGTGTTTNPYRIGTNYGLNETQTGSVIYVTQAAKNAGTYNSYIAVQNTANSTTTVDLKFYAANGTEIVAAAQTADIPAQSTKVFYQNDNSGLPNGFNGGAKVIARDGVSKLAVAVAIYNDGTSYSKAQFLSYNGVPGGAAKVFVPRFVRKILGYNSGMAIQNVGTSDTTVTVVFNFNGVEYTYVSPTIPPNTSHLVYAPNVSVLAPVDSLSESLRQGSAVVTVDDPVNDRIVVTVNVDNSTGIATRLGQGTTYNAPPDGSQSTTIFFPQFAKAVGGVFSSGFQVSNTTNVAGTCNIVYTAAPSANETGVTLPASGSIIRFAPQIAALPNGYNAAVSVTCTQPITGIVNLAAYGRYGDSYTETTGITP